VSADHVVCFFDLRVRESKALEERERGTFGVFFRDTEPRERVVAQDPLVEPKPNSSIVIVSPGKIPRSEKFNDVLKTEEELAVKTRSKPEIIGRKIFPKTISGIIVRKLFEETASGFPP
jgi:hypothetical protein